MADQLAPSESFQVSATEGHHAEYEWNQNVEEVNLNVRCSPGLRAKDIHCVITSGHVKLEETNQGQGQEESTRTKLIDHDTVECVKPDECFWTLDSKRGVVSLTLQKVNESKSWTSVFQGHKGLDGQAQESEKKRLLLERFQLEHAGFDFSGAEINGSCPDPSTFMKGFQGGQP
jgi:hypothetical protein